MNPWKLTFPIHHAVNLWYVSYFVVQEGHNSNRLLSGQKFWLYTQEISTPWNWIETLKFELTLVKNRSTMHPHRMCELRRKLIKPNFSFHQLQWHSTKYIILFQNILLSLELIKYNLGKISGGKSLQYIFESKFYVLAHVLEIFKDSITGTHYGNTYM